MEGVNIKDIIVYQEDHQDYAKYFSKRASISDFKKIDATRIKKEFVVIQNSITPNQEQVFHKEENAKDRYIDIRTYDHNRIQIQNVNNFYINASFMRSVVDNEVYAIFAQAPVRKVLEHFWYACYHYNIRKIIMLCSFEDPIRGSQAQKYWPNVNEEILFKGVNVSIRTKSQEKLEQDYTKTMIGLRGNNGERGIQHIHWSGWGDMAKPIGEKAQGLFQDIVKECMKSIQNKELILIHCSAGIGRTGTLGTVLEALRCFGKHKELSVFEIVDNMRRHRMRCVQTLDQYRFVYNQLQKIL